MNINGLTAQEFKLLQELLLKSNIKQLHAIEDVVLSEQRKRYKV